MAMVAKGVDLNDIRVIRILRDYAGPGELAGEGLELESVNIALWWTTDDETIRRKHGWTLQEYARDMMIGVKEPHEHKSNDDN